jgi:hypothetical protein
VLGSEVVLSGVLGQQSLKVGQGRGELDPRLQLGEGSTSLGESGEGEAELLREGGGIDSSIEAVIGGVHAEEETQTLRLTSHAPRVNSLEDDQGLVDYLLGEGVESDGDLGMGCDALGLGALVS